ncbi:hypothetical protein TNCV_1928831 [Trichonephila clavipes]|nr:hypothetical protein TNCV_1928831 [Trichonephila clavipes]
MVTSSSNQIKEHENFGIQIRYTRLQLSSRVRRTITVIPCVVESYVRPSPGAAENTCCLMTATAGSDVVQSGRPIFDDFFQHLWPYIGNNTANVVFQMVNRLWLSRIAQ